MKHKTDHPEACPCGPRLEPAHTGLVAVHRLTPTDRLARAWAWIRRRRRLQLGGAWVRRITGTG